MAVDLDGNYVPKQKKPRKSKMNQKIDQAVKVKTIEEQILDELKIIRMHAEKQTEFNERMMNGYLASLDEDVLLDLAKDNKK